MYRTELNEFISFKAIGTPIASEHLRTWVDSSHNWQVELGFLNYLFVRVLERTKRASLDCQQYIDCLYDLEDTMYIRIHEFDHEFIDYMSLCVRQNTLSLEEELVNLHNRMCEYIYD